MQASAAPVQTGRGTKALVPRHGLYRLPPGSSAIFSLGRQLRVLAKGTVFVRAVDDMYGGQSAVWSGRLRIEGAPGLLPPPRAQGVVTADGRFRALFRAEEEGQFHAGAEKEPAPPWYFPKRFDVIAERVASDGTRTENRVAVPLEVLSPRPGGAEIRVGLNSNAPPGRGNGLAVFLNGTLVASVDWKGPGYRLVRAQFDGGLLREGTNVVELLGDPGYSKQLDFVEVEAEASPALRGGGLVVRSDADVPGFSVPGAVRAVDVTDAGNETDLPGPVVGGALRVTLSKGRLHYFASTVGSLSFSPQISLEEPKETGKDLLVVGPERAGPPLAPFLAAKARAGITAAFVPFERVTDVYNGGVYGPGGLETMLRRLRPKNLLIASGFNRDCRRREPGASPADDFTPGVPAFFVYVGQWVASDDAYALGGRVGVGRLPARGPGELSAWVAKALAYVPSDEALLLAGRSEREDFGALQRKALGIFPASLVSFEGRSPETVLPAVQGAMEAGARLVVYQGHGQSWELDRGMLAGKDGASLPPSSWLLATCNAAYYFADYEVFLRDWLFHPSGGAVHAIAPATVERSDVQDGIVRTFLAALARDRGITWGAMLNHLKRTVPVPAEDLAKTGVRAGPVAASAEEGKPLEVPAELTVLTLLGDPSAPVLPAAPRPRRSGSRRRSGARARHGEEREASTALR